MDPKKYVPELRKISKKKRESLEELWLDIYNIRRKTSGRKKAKHSANVTIYSEMIKEFSTTKKIKRKEFIFEEKKKEYKTYELKKKGKSLNVIITTDKKVLKDFKHINSKGKINDVTGEYEQEILGKVISKYDLEIDPKINTFYAIYSEDEE